MRKVNRAFVSFLVPAFVAGLLATHHASSQVIYGSLVGNVVDATKAAVPGAIVTITQIETNDTREGETNDVGMYSFPTIPSGTYELKVSKSGFQTALRRDVALTTNSVVRVNFVLQVGMQTENVRVTGEAPILQTDRADVRAEITTNVLQNVPVPMGRNFQQLFISIPGFDPPSNGYSVTSNPTRSLMVHPNGTSREGNDMRIDGATAGNLWLQSLAAYVPALEAIETVNVATNSFDAEQGLAGGTAVNVQVKSGTNRFHGAAFEYHNNNAMMAKPFFVPSGERNPKAILNQFGGTLGGPIKKDKLFFFGSYDGAFTRQTGSRLLTVPTAAMKLGDMSGSPNPIYDPSTGNADGSGRAQFSGKRIPQIDPIVKKILALIPEPTWPNLITNNYYGTAPYSFTRHTTDAKLNYHMSDTVSLAARFGWVNFLVSDPPVFGEKLQGPNVGGGGQPGLGFGNIFSNTVSGTYVASSNFIVDAYFGYNLFTDTIELLGGSKNVGLETLGIPGTNGVLRQEGGWPAFSVDNFTVLGVGAGNLPWDHYNNQFQYVANVNWTKRTHNVRFGMDTVFKALNIWEEAATPQGAFNFSGGVTSVKGGPSPNQYNSFSALLLGSPYTISKGKEEEYKTMRARVHGLYLRDQWQAAPKLTLSYGLRWELYPMPTRKDRGMERYDIQNNKTLVCGIGTVPTDCGYKFSMRQFAPRLGIAYRAAEGFVLRAGYGISWSPFNIGQQLLTNYPIAIAFTQAGVNTYQPAGLLQNGIPAIGMPSLGNGVIDIARNLGVSTLPDEYVRSYIQSWNLTIQKTLRWGFVGQAGYVATRQVHQQYVWDANSGAILGAGQGGQPLVQRFSRSASTNYFLPLGHSMYDSLQATLERRFSGGYQMKTAYTWSKTISYCCNDKQDAAPLIQFPAYMRLNRAVAAYDRTHVLTLSGYAELPMGRGKRLFAGGGPATAVASGWQVNGLFSAYSGLPFNVTASGTSLNTPGNSQRADQVKPKVAILGDVGPGQYYFDPTAYAPVTAVRFGTAGFNAIRGPGLVNVDFALFRAFRLTEAASMQFRAEAFNLTNTPHFNNPAANASTPSSFAQITSTAGTGREGIDQRVFRLGLRLSF